MLVPFTGGTGRHRSPLRGCPTTPSLEAVAALRFPIARAVAMVVFPPNGRRPVAICTSSIPSDQMSLNADAGSPFSSSGAMFAERPGDAALEGRRSRRFIHERRTEDRRDPEVEHFDAPVRRHHDVAALKVAVNYFAVMGVRQCFCDLRPVACHRIQRQSADGNHRRRGLR